jgi:hypothetical protein
MKFNNPREYLQQIEGFDGRIRSEVGAQWATGIASITFRAYGPYGGNGEGAPLQKWHWKESSENLSIGN